MCYHMRYLISKLQNKIFNNQKLFWTKQLTCYFGFAIYPTFYVGEKSKPKVLLLLLSLFFSSQILFKRKNAKNQKSRNWAEPSSFLSFPSFPLSPGSPLPAHLAAHLPRPDIISSRARRCHLYRQRPCHFRRHRSVPTPPRHRPLPPFPSI